MPPPLSLTFYGGAGEIGGNKILLQTSRAKVYLDFGESLMNVKHYSPVQRQL